MISLESVQQRLNAIASLLGEEVINYRRVVAVGDQSSGKSSVLGRIVGRPLFPVGTGAITRRPILVNLVNSELKKEDLLVEDETAIFDHCKHRAYRDCSEIRREIECETSKMAGPDKGINTDVITLTVFSSKFPSFTLVDLPGFVKVPVGDQPENIEEIVRSLALKYVSDEQSIILAVVAANTDVTTNESLLMARHVDPAGNRTLVVVTKLDLMDAGTNAMDLLNGNVIPVKLGIFGVVNQLEKWSKEGNEMYFLYKNYSEIASKHGINNLIRVIHKLLLTHIEAHIPLIKGKINDSILLHRRLLKSYGSVLTDVNSDLLSLLTKFTSSYINKIIGTHSELITSELTGGARINFVFHDIYCRALDSVDPLEGLSRSSILTSIKNSSGVKPSLFIPESCFEQLVKKQISRLEPPSLTCVQLIFDEMERILNNCGTETNFLMIRYPNLHLEIKQVVLNLLKRLIPETNDMVQKLIRIHSAYFNTNHSEFVKEKDEFLDRLKTMEQDQERQIVTFHGPIQTTVRETKPQANDMNNEILIVEHLIKSYFNIVKKTVQDTVPKAIMHFLVNQVIDSLLGELVGNIYLEGNSKFLLEESKEVEHKRNDANLRLSALQKASEIISEVQDYLLS